MACQTRISWLVVTTPPPLLLFLLLLVGTVTQCEGRALRQSKKNSLMNALFKLNFIKAVEPTYVPPPENPSDGDAASLAAADSGNSPFCVNPPNAPSTTPFTSTPSTTPAIPDQPPPLPLPPISPTPPSFEPSPPADSTPGGASPSTSPPTSSSSPNPPQLGPSPPGSAPPSPIVVVPSPPDEPSPGSSGGGGGGGFLPPIIYPPPLAPPMPPGAGEALWCVAKPTVPDPIIQEAMDYACGSGAECTSIMPSGACFQPDNVLAHASYAFNNYWQMTRASGGTCDFGGTATIVTRDPSYDKCQYNLV